ncbi:MAG: hypothetical protein Q7K43_01310 [Candidatus Woesearchaeota archaeon]|nr:hypothetical protein [Candidatus Woesearchaeota archaeon]
MSRFNFPEWSSIGFRYSFQAVAEGIEKRLKKPDHAVQIPADKIAKTFYFLDEVAQGIEQEGIAVVVRRKIVESPFFCISALNEFIQVYGSSELRNYNPPCSIKVCAEKVEILRYVLDHLNLQERIPDDVKNNFIEAQVFFAKAAYRAEKEEHSEAYRRLYDTSADDSPCCA